ncbi:MAG: TerC family protein [Verrucomicrobia bacterium]|nr:TerC family protein [Verrucomicrobiota bacterium]
MPGSMWKWIIFNVFVLAMLALDLGVFHRKSHTVKLKEALAWSALWIAMALAYNAGIYFWLGNVKALEFLTGYVLEKSLSVDNIFVFIMLFAYFRVPGEYQHKVLFWGILGALIMRAVFIALGVTLIQRFEWIIYIFGAVLIYSGIKMGLHKNEEVNPEHNPILRLFRRFFPITPQFEGNRFWVRRESRLMATPLMVVVLVVETTDVVFAVDSIPAVLAITQDPFIVYTSNVFAILGLRALYFALAGVMNIFHFLSYGLSAILVFVGIKMICSHWFKVPIGIALGVVMGVLIVSVIASLIWPEKKKDQTNNMQSP